MYWWLRHPGRLFGWGEAVNFADYLRHYLVSFVCQYQQDSLRLYIILNASFIQQNRHVEPPNRRVITIEEPAVDFVESLIVDHAVSVQAGDPSVHLYVASAVNWSGIMAVSITNRRSYRLVYRLVQQRPDQNRTRGTDNQSAP